MSFEGQHSDPDLDPMAARRIEVWVAGQTDDAGRSPVWSIARDAPTLEVAGSDETQTGRFSVPLSLGTAKLKPQIDYEWRAMTKDPGGLWRPFSPVRALRITSSAPSVTATGVSSVSQMADALFGGTYTDPENNPLAEFMLQMQRDHGLDWANPTRNVWDTGETLPTAR